jgi:hypothetical protein
MSKYGRAIDSVVVHVFVSFVIQHIRVIITVFLITHFL